jgi:hypothetical protein
MMASQVTKAHLDLLRRFGRSQIQRDATIENKRQLWQLSCRAANITPLTYDEVVDQWRKVTTADSKETGIALGETIDPGFISIAITYQRFAIAGHTTHESVLLKSLLAIIRRRCKSDDEFLQTIDRIARKANLDHKKGKAKDD